MGSLVPTNCMEVLPGDRVSISVENMLRFAPMIAPVMHKVNVRTDYFFIPTRLLWPEFTEWITGQSESEAPYTQLGVITTGSIGDHLGLPDGDFSAIDPKVSPMPLAAYRLIWDEYYRDQNLQTEIFTPLVAGNNAAFSAGYNAAPLKRAWQHDYFTSALPFAQKGDAVQIPLTNEQDIPVEYQFRTGGISQNVGQLRSANTGAVTTDVGVIVNQTGPTPLSNSIGVSAGDRTAYDPSGTLVVDVQSDAVDINTLRRAFRLQEWFEKNARGGTRYIENILAHFGIKSSDSRLQRPEYIGGSKQNMIISEVLATAQNSAEDTALGQMGGHGISVGGGNKFSYRAEEHGYIIGIINVQPVTAYQQGLHRSFTRFNALDYAWPSFANLGEQPILNKEIYLNQTGLDNTFGYTPRYSEYKYMNSSVHGDFRDSLSFWHLGRIFDAPPVLNASFIEANPSTRIFAVTSEADDHLWCHVFNNVNMVRKLPRFGIPTI